LEHGEERLVNAVERGIIPHSIAMEIARAKDADVQKALADAYEAGSIPGNQIVAIRRIVEQRNLTGKGLHSVNRRTQARKSVTPTALIRAYRKEADRQKLIVRKATLAQERLLFVVNALRSLLSDAAFLNLLRAEDLSTLPRPLAERVSMQGG
jgi:ParB family chromosome partitioning protein